MSYNEDLEKRIVRHLCKTLVEAGWMPFAVDDGGDGLETVTTEDEVVEAVFAVDEARAFFRKQTGLTTFTHSVLLVLGNGNEVISDNTANSKDDFDALVSSVTEDVEDWT